LLLLDGHLSRNLSPFRVAIEQHFRHIDMRTNWSGDWPHVKDCGAVSWHRTCERVEAMRRTRRLALGFALAALWLTPAFTPAFAVEPDDLPWDEIDRVLKEQPAPDAADTPDVKPPAAPAKPAATPVQRQPDPAPAKTPEVLTSTPPPVPRPGLLEPAQSPPAAAPVPAAPVQAAAPPAIAAPQTAQTPAQAPATSPASAQTTAPVATPPAATATAPASPAPAAPAAVAAAPAPGQLYLPVKPYFETKAVVTLKDFEEADRTALRQYYEAHMGQALWTTRDGFNASGQNVIDELRKADDWGLATADYKIPGLTKIGAGEFPEDDLVDAEIKLSLVAMEYARHARGFRIAEPSQQLSSYLDRKPQLIEPAKVIDGLVTAADKGAYLRSLHPTHPQFERLRQKLLELRHNANREEFEKIPDGPKLTPGKSHWQIALVRRRLKVQAAGPKPDGTASDENYYDDTLAGAVERFKEKNELQPVNTTITTELRKSLNAESEVSEEMLLANMEEWRWMPEDLGSMHIAVNIPEFTVRVMKNGGIIHSERIVSGKYETQTPIFSNSMRKVVFQPSWNVPESIKYNELLPKLRAGDNPIAGQGLAIKRNGRDIDVWDVDWNNADMKEYWIYQPPGETNVLGVVKFLFPNKHSVYLHDTPAKKLFNEKIRMFSHGCMRVRNPVQLAEVIMNEDKGWDKAQVTQLAYDGEPDNEVALDHPIPVHVTYFTAWVEDDGQLKTFADVYGHQKRIILGLEGRWSEIVKNRDHLLAPDADEPPVAHNRDDWGDNGENGNRRASARDADEEPARPVRRARPPRVTYREPPPQPVYKKSKSVGDIIQQVFGGF
jgi:L,D-transpeptidase YcbB